MACSHTHCWHQPNIHLNGSAASFKERMLPRTTLSPTAHSTRAAGGGVGGTGGAPAPLSTHPLLVCSSADIARHRCRLLLLRRLAASPPLWSAARVRVCGAMSGSNGDDDDDAGAAGALEGLRAPLQGIRDFIAGGTLPALCPPSPPCSDSQTARPLSPRP